ncbi:MULTISPECIES: DUF503 family protein [Bacillaceae]|uniref:DUF503 domain-containing protein n=1 Tax=Bacillaceae TaxID=186817 RepID=UPI001BDE06CF|nr:MULTISPECIES: DUF503 family protein [Bacillaceae]MDX8362210.1 DUF503 family protein [Cytobacillus sp. IB215316]MDX8365107.1 DUF503 family protein [Cytobacillus sp. IB215665]
MIGYVECECIIYDASSLKEKRSVLQRILTRQKQQFNVSVSEIDFHDVWQRTKIAIVTVSNNKKTSEIELQHALKLLDSFPEIERTITTYEWF